MRYYPSNSETETSFLISDKYFAKVNIQLESILIVLFKN